MVTRKKQVILRNLFSENSPTESEIVEATVAFVNGATIVIDDVPESLKYLELVEAPATPTQMRVAKDSLKTWKRLLQSLRGNKSSESELEIDEASANERE